MNKKQKKKKWVLPRHKLVRKLIELVIGGYTRRKYGVTITKYDKRDDTPYLILYNHQTAYDQFFVGLAFDEPLYYVATEDIFSMGFVSKIIKYLVAPIPIKKQTTDPRAVINCIKVAKEGGSIAIAPEGNRTYSGVTEYIKPSIAALVRHLRLPVAFFKIEGGYGIHPRWSDDVRRGKMRAYVSRVVYPTEYEIYSDAELCDMITRELYCDETLIEDEYQSEHLAEYIERAIYVCDECGLSSFYSSGDTIECLRCKKKARYLPNKKLVGADAPFPFSYLKDWYEYQSNYINSLDLTKMTDEPLYTERANMSEVILYKKKRAIKDGVEISLYPGKILIDAGDEKYAFPFDKMTAASVLGKNKLNIYYDGKVYQIKGDERFCAVKYVNLYYRYKNITKGEENGKFLGL